MRFKVQRRLLRLLALFVVPALAGAQDPTPHVRQQEHSVAPAASQNEPSDATRSAYILGADDEVSIVVVEAEEISGGKFRIDTDGHINIPLAGRLQVAGLTAQQFEESLIERLKVYVRDPHVAVTVTEFRSQPVSVIGAVKKPGVHQLRGRKTLVEILSLAEGLRDDAGHTVKITRRLERGIIPLPSAQVDSSNQFSVAEVSLESVMNAENPEENVFIEPHDVVSVPRAEMVYVVGAVKKAGGFVLHERENISVLQVLALAGGLEPTASGKHARILRAGSDGAERAEISVNLKHIMTSKSDDLPLQRDDILFVPSSGGKMALAKAAETAIRIGTGVVIWGR